MYIPTQYQFFFSLLVSFECLEEPISSNLLVLILNEYFN